MDLKNRLYRLGALIHPRGRHGSTLARASVVMTVSLSSALGARGMLPRTTKTNTEPPVNGRAIADTITHVVMKNVDFYVDPEIVLHVRILRGTVTSKTSSPILFDDKRSFIEHISTASVGITARDLSTLLNKYVFAYPGAPLKHMSVTTSGTQIIQRGTLHKGVDIPFEITAQLGMTPQGLIRIHPTRTKFLGVNGGGLMKVLGLSLEKLIDLSKAKGASVRGNDIFLDPILIMPPPTIEGHVTAVKIEGDQIVQTFGGPAERASTRMITPPHPASSFIYYKGGKLRFGKLTMTDADLEIVPLEPASTFGFDLDRYLAQLTAGYERIRPDLGLEAYMRDVNKLGDTRGVKASPH